ncbi:uncharacterized protein LOC124881124 isoform X2 [Girardinichthys multiradiatus]|uniref:uncharacterized protein LOC124881124 isoform X2 n=1 Tax=Girardinichthys multiradiatus TaxID=208333 RepID=UPI001FAE6C37|nr:uncharacterized protein LOC124881124 isoform X2 [Girardinichthys multiradiatus]
MSDLSDFLRGRGLPEDAISLLEEQKIDWDVIGLMDDATLANYIPSYGDRIVLFNFCKSKQPLSKRKQGLLARVPLSEMNLMTLCTHGTHTKSGQVVVHHRVNQ